MYVIQTHLMLHGIASPTMALKGLLWTIPLLGCCGLVSVSSDNQTTEPRPTELTKCPEYEEYRSCEPCNKTCADPNPICPAQCASGCFCQGNRLRDINGKCVLPGTCFNVISESIVANLVMPLPYQLTCGPHQEYRACQQCERTCSSQQPVCSSNDTCNAGCFCQDGWVKAPSGQCVKPEQCPRAEVSNSGNHEVSIEDCAPDEVYLSCGWCEPSCWDPNPECPRGVCTRGCLCIPPLLRHHSGHCVEPAACTPQKCADPNEEYVCRYGCEARCDKRLCKHRPRRCQLGCHCRLGLLRDINRSCVPANKCSNVTDDIQDIFVNTSQKGKRDSISPIFAASVFGPIIKVVKRNMTKVSEPKQLKLFESINAYDTNHNKTLAASNINKSAAINTTNNLKAPRLNAVFEDTDSSNMFFQHYIIDPFRESFDAKTFGGCDVNQVLPNFIMPSTKQNKKITIDFTPAPKTKKKDITIHPQVAPKVDKKKLNNGQGITKPMESVPNYLSILAQL